MFRTFQCGADGYHKLGGSYYLPKNYSRTIAPIDHDHSDPIEVTLKIDQLDVLEVDDHKFTIKLQMYLGILWNDSRIFHNDTSEEVDDKGTNLDLKHLDLLWVPDLDIYNLSKIENFRVIRNLAGNFFIESCNVTNKYNTIKYSFLNIL